MVHYVKPGLVNTTEKGASDMHSRPIERNNLYSGVTIAV